MDMQLLNLAKRVGEALKTRNLILTTAESCTAGMVAATITSISGSASWFERGFITYSNDSKQEMLGVEQELLHRFGAVSVEVAKEMAEGALRNSRAEVSLAVTGIAGPTGGTEDKPVGTVCFAWAIKEQATKSAHKFFLGDREAIRQQATKFVLEELINLLFL